MVAMLYTGYCYLLQKRLERALQKRDEAFLPQVSSEVSHVVGRRVTAGDVAAS